MADEPIEPGELTEEDLVDASPDTLIQVRYGDLRELEGHANALAESLRDAKIDQDEMIAILGIQPLGPVTPHEVNLLIMAKLKILMKIEDKVNEAGEELLQRSKLLGAPTLDMGNGQKAALVGRRVPKEFLEPPRQS